MRKGGDWFTAVDPEYNSGNVMDLRRIVAPRVRVRLCRVHHLRVRDRYEVETEDGRTFNTGRLYKTKEVV